MPRTLNAKCNQCDKEFYKRPSQQTKRSFCSWNCWRTTQKREAKFIGKIKCLECQKPIASDSNRTRSVRNRKYCSITCSNKGRISRKWSTKRKPIGQIRNSRTLRRRMLEEVEYKCTGCGNTGKWLGKNLRLEIDHIDGNHENNKPSNLRFLCPNCHRQTPTWGKHKRKADGVR